MDSEKFGRFVATVRKEKHMTQAELAQKLQVTDKAVSRWERGLGFPDIGTIEPLADALGISVLELMRSERNAEVGVTNEDAAEIVINTLHVAKLQRRRMLKRLLLVMLLIAAVILCWIIGSGLMTRTDVYLFEWTVMPSGDVLIIRVGIAGPMGYIRDCSDISRDPERVELRFFSAFGGLNSNMGAQNVFVIPLEEGCREICFERGHGMQAVLRKDETTGAWELVRQEPGADGEQSVVENEKSKVHRGNLPEYTLLFKMYLYLHPASLGGGCENGIDYLLTL